MQHIATIAPKIGMQTQDGMTKPWKKSQNEQSAKNADVGIVDSLVRSLKATHPAWRNAFKSTLEHDEWKKQLIIAMGDAGINTAEQVDNCKAKARQDTNPFMPSVGLIVQWCKSDPTELGLPNTDAAYNMAAHANWKHYIVYLAAEKVGTMEIRNSPKDKYFKAFEREYLALVARTQRGEVFEKPESKPALAADDIHPEFGRMKPMTAKEAFKEMGL